MKNSSRSFLVILLAVTALVILGLLCWLGLWIPNYPSEVTYLVRGIDVSHHQKEIRWDAVKASGIHFAYIKATEGADFIDAQFSENWRGAETAGLVRGAYHFFTLGVPGALQASNFITAVPIDSQALPTAIDLELSGYNVRRTQSPNEFAKELSVFFDTVSARYGKLPVIYTTHDFQKKYLKTMSVDRLWIREIITQPRQNWMFWQFSERGRIHGIHGFVDLDVFSGDRVRFEEFLQERVTR
jgi:lysozyme